MRKQQQIWQTEHDTATLIPDEMMITSSMKPSSYVVKFVEFLRTQMISLHGTVIDIGAGKGRNTLYMAQQGFTVTAMDYIATAIDHIEQTAKLVGLSRSVKCFTAPMDQPWPFIDSSFDFAIDCFSSIDVETKEGREMYRHELLRTLKPSGIALVVVVAADDEFEAKLMRDHPGSEPNSSIWPESGKFQKNYDEAELRKFYQAFEVIAFEKISKPTHKMNRSFTASNFWVVLRKPI
jgi:SAM-dependent methyltransferase